MSANDKQIGGNHYAVTTIQPWDYVIANNLGYLEGTAIKYLSRYRQKGGIQDLRKAIHFIEKLIEVEESKNPTTVIGAGIQEQKRQRHWELEYVMKAWGAKAQADKAYEDWLKENENVPQHRGT